MKLLYDTETGEVFYAIYDKDLFTFTHTTNIPLSEFDIDEELIENKELCRDLSITQFKFNIQRQRKYYIKFNIKEVKTELFERDDWVEFTVR